MGHWKNNMYFDMILEQNFSQMINIKKIPSGNILLKFSCMWKNKTESLDRKTRNACNNLFGDDGDASSSVFEIKNSVHTRIPTPCVRASSPIDTFFVFYVPSSEHFKQRHSSLKLNFNRVSKIGHRTS